MDMDDYDEVPIEEIGPGDLILQGDENVEVSTVEFLVPYNAYQFTLANGKKAGGNAGLTVLRLRA